MKFLLSSPTSQLKTLASGESQGKPLEDRRGSMAGLV